MNKLSLEILNGLAGVKGTHLDPTAKDIEGGIGAMTGNLTRDRNFGAHPHHYNPLEVALSHNGMLSLNPLQPAIRSYIKEEATLIPSAHILGL